MEVVYNEESYEITDEMKESFNEKGYIIIRELFSLEELLKLIRNYEEGQDYHRYMYKVKDSSERPSLQTTWNYPGNDVFGMAARLQRIVETCSQLLGGEVYHYHSKLVIKDPKTGGERTWKQDYGHWYNFSVLFPELITAFIAIDPCAPENGGLQVLEGSHKAGRIEHKKHGDEIGADVERVEHLQKVCPLKYVDLEPGDAVFLHCNVLHKSDPNSSDRRRIAYLPVYNLKSNSPTKEIVHPQYKPLDVVHNGAVLDCENFTDLEGKEFLNFEDPELLKILLRLNTTDLKTPDKNS